MKVWKKVAAILPVIGIALMVALSMAAPSAAQGRNATALVLPPVTYPAAQALADTAFYITDMADQTRSFTEIMTFIRDAAGSLHLTCISVRASNGVINRQSPEWIEIRDVLRAAGYTVATNNRTQEAEICW